MVESDWTTAISDLEIDALDAPLAADVRGSLERGAAAGVTFEVIGGPDRQFRAAVQRAITAIAAKDERGLLPRFLTKGPYTSPGRIKAKEKQDFLSDEEVAAAIRLIHSSAINSFQVATHAELYDAVQRYHTLLQMTFATNIYKLFETPASQVMRFLGPPSPAPEQPSGNAAMVEVRCQKCGSVSLVQANLGQSLPLQPGRLPFPADNKFRCPGCAAEADLGDLRRQIEAQSRKPVVA